MHNSAGSAVLVPGLGLTREAWEPTLRELGAGPGTRVVELPGYGEAASPGADLSPRALALRLVDLLPAGESHVLFGHSASCQVVAHAAVLAPDRVAGLVLVGPTTDPRARSWPRLAGRWLRTAAHEPPRQVPVLVRSYGRTGLRTMVHGMNAARRDRIEETLARVECPVLLVRGTHDRIARHDWLEVLADGRDRRVVTLPTGGHMVPLVRGREVAAAVTDFFGQGSLGRSGSGQAG